MCRAAVIIIKLLDASARRRTPYTTINNFFSRKYNTYLYAIIQLSIKHHHFRTNRFVERKIGYARTAVLLEFFMFSTEAASPPSVTTNLPPNIADASNVCFFFFHVSATNADVACLCIINNDNVGVSAIFG